MATEKTYYFPWVRKGLSNRITEPDCLGRMQNAGSLAKQRPVLSISTEYEVTPPADTGVQKAPISMSETKEVQLISPGDILGVNPAAIMKVAPKPGSSGFATQFYPYLEFWEPDFAWRYTPAAPNGNKLRPWLALLVCRKDRCSIKKLSDGRSYVTLIVENKEQYEQIFPLPENTWKSAHAQGIVPGHANVSRMLGLRTAPNLTENTEYDVFLVPAFETGRLRGLGYGDDVLKEVVAQAPAWEASLEEQKSKHPKQPLDFPVYYSWSFTSGQDSFDGLVEKLKIADGFTSDIKVDVTHMGEGLDYDLLKPRPVRKVIGMPVATQTVDYQKGKPFPAGPGTDEAEIYKRLKDLVSKNPVFLENTAEISGTPRAGVPVGVDDPWVVPPVYGGKHIMATTIDEAANKTKGTPWLSQLNLDVHNRAAAGLGKRTVQIHQEAFVNRAWKQVEAVNALNRELYQRLMSVNINKILKNKTLKPYKFIKGKPVKPSATTRSTFIAGMMRNLGSMRDAKAKAVAGQGATSLSTILENSQIPQAFSTASFQHLTDGLARQVDNLDSTTLMESIADKQIFKVPPHSFYQLPTLKQVRDTTNTIYVAMIHTLCEALSEYFLTFPDDSADHTDISEENFKKIFPFIPKPVDQTIFSPIPAQDRSAESTTTSEYFNTLPRMYWGYSLNQYKGEKRKNVIGLPDYAYINLFGDSPSDNVITRVGGEENGIYFIRTTKLENFLQAQYHDGTRAACFYVAVKERIKHSYYIFTYAYSWGQEKIVEAKYNPKMNTIRPLQDGVFRQSGPYYLVINRPQFNHYDRYLDTMQDFVEFQKARLNPAWMKEWNQLHLKVKQMEQEKADREKARPQTQPPTVNTPEVDKLQQGFADSEAYERMRHVAETYYNEFFANNESGAALRDSYIDELLRSKYPILAYPIFPEPVYHYLKMFSDKFILPCVDDLPESSIAVFSSNPAFEEAYLCGMNTEMGRELLWREYPTDQRGSYFRKFWDSETSAADIRNENFFDVEPLHTWKGDLGDNHLASKTGLLLFAIKGRLMRQYPSTEIYLHRAAAGSAPRTIGFDAGATVANGGILKPVLQAFLREDILMVGFKTTFDQAVGNPKNGDYGFYLTFKEDVQDLNFQNDPDAGAADAARVADVLKNDPTLFGKHLALFI